MRAGGLLDDEDWEVPLSNLAETASVGGSLLDDTLVVWSSELGTPEQAMNQ